MDANYGQRALGFGPLPGRWTLRKHRKSLLCYVIAIKMRAEVGSGHLDLEQYLPSLTEIIDFNALGVAMV